MSYALRILPRAEKQLSRVNSPQYDSIKAKILDLGTTPRPAGCKKLRGHEGWRIIAKAVTVLKIGHRGEIYK